MSFVAGAPWTLGVEEELLLVDPRTLETAPVFEQGIADPPRLKPELFSCFVETTTPICADPDEVLEQVGRLRRAAAARAAAAGATVVAIGTHPLARSLGQPIVPEQRYEKMVGELGDAVYRQLVCGLHVHVGVPGEEACLRAFDGVLRWAPVLIALAANSPFAEGRDTGLRSVRIARLAELPAGGAPPELPSWAAWEAETAVRDYTRLWWDVRPHPRLGTLEVRLTDQQTSVRRSAGIAALVQALVAASADTAPEPYDRQAYEERRARAAKLPPDPDEVAALRMHVEPAARALGGWPLAEELLAAPSEADLQRELGPAEALRRAAGQTLVFDS